MAPLSCFYKVTRWPLNIYPRRRNPHILCDWLKSFRANIHGSMMLFFISHARLQFVAWPLRYRREFWLLFHLGRTKMPRITRSAQKQIEFRCQKTRSQQKKNEGTIAASRSKHTRECSISPRKRRDLAKGKPRMLSFASLLNFFCKPM